MAKDNRRRIRDRIPVAELIKLKRNRAVPVRRFLGKGAARSNGPRPVDFTFKTDPQKTSKCDFAVMGDGANGKYYKVSQG